jgi:iron complex outermembrane receptor protein
MKSRTAVLAAAAAAILSMAHAAKADELGQAPPVPVTAQRAFDIAAQPLATALNAFGRQAGLQVSIEASIARGVQSPAVSGTMTPEQALRLLLTGTGIQARFTTDGGVLLTRPVSDSSGALQLDPVQVQGNVVPPQAIIDNIPPPYAGGQVARGGQLGALGNRDVMDTPFNQSNYTAKKAQDQQAQTVRDVLLDDPSARAYLHDGGPGSDTLYIRGFPVSPTTMTFNGTSGVLPYESVMPEFAERIEVLKGPSALLNGMTLASNIGGTINLVPKRAPDDGLTQITAAYGSSGQFGSAADIGRRFGNDKQFGARFNGAFRAGNTAVQWNTNQRALAALGLDYRGDRIRLSADMGYQYQYIGGAIPYLGVTAAAGLPWAPTASGLYGQQPWNYYERKDLFGVLRGEVDITERITGYAVLGARDFRRSALYGGSTLTINSANGNATTSPNIQGGYESTIVAEAGFRGFVDTGPIGHEIVVGGATVNSESGSALASGAAFATNIFNPVIMPRASLVLPTVNKTSTNTLNSLAFADTLSAADKRIQLTAGARLQQVQSINYTATGAVTSTYDQSAVSPAVALVFKPWENVSVYGNYIQGLQPGIVVGAPFTNAGEAFPPYKTTQYEAGVKADWGKFTTTASLFEISRPSTIANVATNTLVLAGEQRNQGLEINLFGEPVEGTRLLGGIMLLNAVLTKTQGGTTDGWIAPFAPPVQLNLAGEWDLPYIQGLTATGRVIYTGQQFIDTTWPRRTLAGWTRFDVGLRYAIDNVRSPTAKPIVVRFNVENLFDTSYWASGLAATTMSLGAPRTFRLALTTDF